MCHYHLKKRLSIFVDGNKYVLRPAEKTAGFFDPKRVLPVFFLGRDGGYTLVNAFWYTGLKDPQDQRGFRDALISLGLYPSGPKSSKNTTMILRVGYSQKANLDIEIAIDMFKTPLISMTRWLLFSGDGDFERAIELFAFQKYSYHRCFYRWHDRSGTPQRYGLLHRPERCQEAHRERLISQFQFQQKAHLKGGLFAGTNQLKIVPRI